MRQSTLQVGYGFMTLSVFIMLTPPAASEEPSFSLSGMGQTGIAEAICFSPDGKLLAAGCADKTTRVWDMASGKCVATLTGIDRAVRSVSFSPDGKVLAAGSVNREIRLWDVATGKVLRSIDSGVWDHRVAFSPDGKILASGQSEGIVLFDPASGKEIGRLDGHKGHILSITFSPDGKTLASAGVDHTIRLWDVASRRQEVSQKVLPDEIAQLAFSPNGRTLALNQA